MENFRDVAFIFPQKGFNFHLTIIIGIMGFRLYRDLSIYGLFLLVLWDSATNLNYLLELLILAMACTPPFKTQIL